MTQLKNSSEKKNKWEFRGVQLDLARQIETIDYIHSFIDFAARWNFNKLFLYLEARIRTKSFPYPDLSQSYTPEQMKEIVSYASERGMEIIPIIPNLGHTEQFLQYPQLSDIAELRDGGEGRIGNSLNMVCPSLEKTYSFFHGYYSEIALIFPSKYIHVGNDESWNLGCCKLCQKHARQKGLFDIFSKHLLETYKIVTRELGKKMMMWDDMFEVCPESLEMLPKDVVLCCWLYDNVFDKPYSHFFNRKKVDLFAKYDKLGLSYIFCTREITTANIINFSYYASKHNAMGGLVTTWEHSQTFLYQYFPNIAFAGKLWIKANLNDAKIIFKQALAELFEIDNPLFLSAMEVVANRRQWYEFKKLEDFLKGFPSQFEQEREKETDLLLQVLSLFKDKAKTSIAQLILDDILIGLEREILQYKLRRLVPEIYEMHSTSNFKKSNLILNNLKECVKEVCSMAEKRKKQWMVIRPSIKPDYASKFFEDMNRNFNSIISTIEQRDNKRKNLLNLYCFLPDRCYLPWTKLLIRFEGLDKWQEIYSGEIKPFFDEETFYQVSFPISETKVPKMLRLEVWGYGGQGFRFVEIVNSDFRYVPKTVIKTEGIVLDYKHLLYDDYRWCYLGEHDVFRTFHTPESEKVRHAVELVLTCER